MMHVKRRWQVADVATPVELVEKLTKHVWCRCQAFRLGGYLFVNDSTSADGAQEYAILMADQPTRQVESITFGWCSEDGALEYITQALAGEYDANDWGSRVTASQFETPEAHSRCGCCA